MNRTELSKEWQTIQNQYDSYEKCSLLIKLFNIALFSAALLMGGMNVVILFVLLVVWLQDAIWKTFQSRIESRLLQLETALADDTATTAMPFQYNRDYAQTRPSTLCLIKAYMHQAVRPTIAFPHVVLILIGAGMMLSGS